MPKLGMRQEFELPVRGKTYQKLDAEVGITVSGRELPNMSIVGEALEIAIALIKDKIKKSYEVVPVRDGATPMGDPAPKLQGHAMETEIKP